MEVLRQQSLFDEPVQQINAPQDIYNSVYAAVKEHGTKIKHFLFEDGSRDRFFIESGQRLCKFIPRSRTRGRYVTQYQLTSPIKEIVFREDSTDKAWRKMAKYRRYAQAATHTNKFIENCLGLPETKEAWLEDGKKELYEYGVTTGADREGEVITVSSLNAVISADLEKAIADKEDFKCDYVNTPDGKFRGLEPTIQLKRFEDGSFQGWLSLEFAGCANGHYYLLINDKHFIYYDKD